MYKKIAYIRLLSKFHLVVKIAIFGIFSCKFFDHMLTYCSQNLQLNLPKIINFSKQSKFRKKSVFIFCFLVCVLCSYTKSDTLLVGTNAEFPPFTSIVNGKIVGFDIDVITEVAARLGKKVQLKDMPFDALIPDAVLGHVDCIAAGMSYTEERAQRVFFTKPYITSDPLVILTTANSKAAVSLEDLVGKNVVVNEGFTADSLLSAKNGVHIIRLPTITDGFLALMNKRAYAFVTARSTYVTFCKNQKNTLQAYPIEGSSETCALIVPKSKPELLKAIQEALDAMEQDGTIASLKERWGL